MSWASRRRAAYAIGLLLFFGLIVGVPLAYHFLTIKPTCFDGTQNQGETAPDKGGPCAALDARALSPAQILWSRSFKVRDGSYSALAYIQNTNQVAGISAISYRFGLYDDRNILIAERTGTAFVMPSGITPIFEPSIATGNRVVAHTYFEFSEDPSWSRLQDLSHFISINDVQMSDTDSAPRLTASAQNTSVADFKNVYFIATIFDPTGNAFAASQTAVEQLPGSTKTTITFTWPTAFTIPVGRIDIIPVVAPRPAQLGA